LAPPVAPPVVPPPVTPQAVAPPSTAPAAHVGPRPVTPAPPGMVTLINPRKNNQELHVPAAEVAAALRAGALYPNGSTTAPAAVPTAPTDTSAPATDPDDSPDPYENAVLMHFKDGRFLYVTPQDEAEVLTGGGRRATPDEIVKVERLGASGVYVGKFNGKKR
jgi:hypothetical protein